MEIIYQKIVNTFNDNMNVFTDRSLPKLRHIDIYFGQPDRAEDFEFFLPALFINWQISEPGKHQPNILTLEFHLVQDPGAGTENYSNRLPKGLEYISMVKTVKYMLNQLRAINTTGLQYVSERPNATPYFNYHIVTYECFIDKTDESFTKGSLSDVELDGYNAIFGIKEKSDIPSPPDIETF